MRLQGSEMLDKAWPISLPAEVKSTRIATAFACYSPELRTAAEQQLMPRD